MSIQTEKLIQQLKVIADMTRMRLLALCLATECSVSELTLVVGESQPRISQHLRALCESGMLVKHRDGKRIYYRVPRRGTDADTRDQLLQLLPNHERQFIDDYQRLRELRGAELIADDNTEQVSEADRAIYRSMIELTVTSPVGALLDIGCGRGQLLKLLASRAQRVVGVDIDAEARQIARAELMLSGVPGCTLRKGDMYRLPFDDAEFDTIILDDVLGSAASPVKALIEARRLLKPGGRLLLLLSLRQQPAADLQLLLAEWCRTANLRIAPPRIATRTNPVWMLAVASSVEQIEVAA